jgi:hypothetical protein
MTRSGRTGEGDCNICSRCRGVDVVLMKIVKPKPLIDSALPEIVRMTKVKVDDEAPVG